MRHEDGATFNPFDDPSEGGTPWALDMIPLPIPATEWALLETGLIQRAHLLEQILADVYGPQRLLSGGRIPAELIFANPSFLRPCHGIKPAGNRFLAYYAADLYRGPDGRFRVLRDYGANPIGMGYALENRIVLSRVFSEIYHQTQIHRLAPFFHTFHRSLVQRASVRREDPAIVLLSPGPLNRFYFEHALLSRYLNYPLVEYQDLTVRNGEVFLKKLTGLEPVEAIFRHMGDTGSDPFALRQGTETGVSGLIQVSREQDIDIINPIGSGFVDTPALPALLPSLCRHLMGEELALENHPVWWCHIAEHRDFVLSHLDQLTLGPAMDRSSAGPSSEDPRQAIQAMPHAVLAREPIRPATVPAWDETGVHAGYALMRVFVCATQRGFAVMPGGMAVTAGDITTLTGDFPERQRSKDIWVLSDQPVAHFSLMDGLQKPAEFRRSNDLPSRVADHLLWLGRYLERAEGRVRLLRSVLRRLAGEDRLSDIPELPFLLNLLRKQNSIAEAPEGESGLPRYRALTAQLKAALYQRDRTDSVAAVLHRVQVAARHVRDWFSLDAWRAINRLEDFKDSPADDSLELLDDTLFALNAFSGLAMESMTRGLGWRFLDMGRRIERAINLANLVRIGLFQAGTESRNALEALLEVAASIMTYRARYRTTFQLAPVLDLLLIDESNPKSLAFQCSRLAAHVEHLPRQGQRRFASQEERMALEMLTGVRLLDLTPLENRQGDNDFRSLMRFLDFMDRRLKDFAQVISTHYLSRIPATPHYSTILTEAPRV
jgi:uncharacterized circularly permuted ATP-grasp superfamily protein/uncharacterized alpha-E superfamily protein